MMDSRDCPCGQSRVRDEAAQWFVRLQDPVMSLDERQRFEAWLGEHASDVEVGGLLRVGFTE